MPVHKIAISVPREVMVEVDRAARERGVARSRFISDMLRLVAQARSDAEVTRRLDAVFADARVASEQRSDAERDLAAGSRNGAEW